MKINKLLILALAVVTILTSCVKEIEFKGEQMDSKLVINCVAEVGQPVKAYVGKSIFFLDDDKNMEAPADLVAMLYVNGNRIGQMTPQVDTVWSQGFYWTDEYTYDLWRNYTYPYVPEVGDVVKITASANGFDDVDGESSSLPDHTQCGIKDVRQTESFSWGEYDEEVGDTVLYCYETYELILELTDLHPNETDLFRLYIDQRHHYFEGYDQDKFQYYAFIEDYSDPVFSAASAGDMGVIDQLEGQTGTFTDQFFDGRSYALKLLVGFYYTKTVTAEVDFSQIAVYLEHITKEYYNYLNTCDQGSEASQLFAEPIQTYSNVNGGYGIVGGRAVDTLWLALPLSE